MREENNYILSYLPTVSKFLSVIVLKYQNSCCVKIPTVPKFLSVIVLQFQNFRVSKFLKCPNSYCVKIPKVSKLLKCQNSLKIKIRKVVLQIIQTGGIYDCNDRFMYQHVTELDPVLVPIIQLSHLLHAQLARLFGRRSFQDTSQVSQQAQRLESWFKPVRVKDAAHCLHVITIGNQYYSHSSLRYFHPGRHPTD